MTFTTQQIEQMDAPLNRERVAHRRQAGQQLSYIETWDAMEAANRIWGYDGWCYSLDRLEHQAGVWVAIVTVTVYAGDRLVTRQDAGAAIPAAKRGEEPSPEATETAIKGAVSDATKRALRSFGNQFGLSLYDKDAPEHDARPQPPTPLRDVPRPAPAAVAAASERVVSQPAAGDQLLGDVRGPQLAARLRAALGSQGYDPAEQADWITRQIKASGKSGLPAFTLAEGKALLERANASAAPAPEGAR